jgi:hypothetical protein
VNSLTATSSLVGTAATRLKLELTLVALLITEILYLTLTFDT